MKLNFSAHNLNEVNRYKATTCLCSDAFLAWWLECVMKACAKELQDVLTDTFNTSLSQAGPLTCSTVTPLSSVIAILLYHYRHEAL